MSQRKSEAWWGCGWQGGISSYCVCICVLMVCVNVVCAWQVCVHAHTHVWGVILRLYVVVNPLHVLSEYSHTSCMIFMLYVYM